MILLEAHDILANVENNLLYMHPIDVAAYLSKVHKSLSLESLEKIDNFIEQEKRVYGNNDDRSIKETLKDLSMQIIECIEQEVETGTLTWGTEI